MRLLCSCDSQKPRPPCRFIHLGYANDTSAPNPTNKDRRCRCSFCGSSGPSCTSRSACRSRLIQPTRISATSCPGEHHDFDCMGAILCRKASVDRAAAHPQSTEATKDIRRSSFGILRDTCIPNRWTALFRLVSTPRVLQTAHVQPGVAREVAPKSAFQLAGALSSLRKSVAHYRAMELNLRPVCQSLAQVNNTAGAQGAGSSPLVPAVLAATTL
jgi:hypothetical protein